MGGTAGRATVEEEAGEAEVSIPAIPPMSLPAVRVPSLILLLIVLSSLCCFTDFRSFAQSLPQEEVNALRQIAIKLNKDVKQWDFTINPCSNTSRGGWVNVTGDVVSNVTCDCSSKNSTVCHVISIELKRQNLTGVLPVEMTAFTYLRYLDLSRNYISGSIPAEWASLPLLNLSIHGNRISGQIPKELGNMPVIRSLQFENNRLEGPLPVELGNLITLKRLFISGNNITGRLPSSFAKLKNLTDFRMDGNAISGEVPDYIQNWRSVNRIDMMGTSLIGPVPDSISYLKNLTELRITDLSGPSSTFPALQNAEHLTELVLRNCSISGGIPSYIGTMKYLKVLDLSFNKLTGQIPSSFEGLTLLEYLYLTNNALTGEVPSWMLRNKATNKKNMDISYNSFTGSTPTSCQEGNLNMVASYSSTNDNSVPACFRKNFPCTDAAQYNSLFINCGGRNVIVDGIEYDGDSSQIGTSMFYYDKSGRWAYSSTGDFIGNENADFIAKNTSKLKMTYPDLYTEARLAPISLKYYGLCLENGNYSVNLHFAEIIFTDDRTYWSLGKRIFDVFIQGEKILANFNIKEQAGGSGRAIIMKFNASVKDNTLEIHLYWAGKGTTAIPYRGIYGPLISAISVTRFDIGRRNKLSVGAISGIVVSVCLFIIVLAVVWLKCNLRKPATLKERHNELNTQFNYFSVKDIEVATSYFDPTNKIGEGGFGPVYKGLLADGTQVAVKLLSPKSTQGSREFLNEIGTISALQHPNLVKLFGWCIGGDQLYLVYEYMENNNLGRALFGKEDQRLKLNWTERRKICLGIAKGLSFLHEESRLHIVHRDIKATNILLDRDFNPKISDFGLAKLREIEKTHISTRIAGTIGYMAPEYATRGYLTDKADVYSFGVVILEIVSGKRNTNYIPEDELFYLLDWALVLHEQGRLLELVDPDLGSEYSEEEALRMLNVCLLCTNSSPVQRPTMSTVVRMLAGEMSVPDPGAYHSGPEAWTLGTLWKPSHNLDGEMQSSSSINQPSSYGEHVFSPPSLSDINGTNQSTSS